MSVAPGTYDDIEPEQVTVTAPTGETLAVSAPSHPYGYLDGPPRPPSDVLSR